MADSKIEWTDKVWNPTVGCSIVSPGCTNCYATKMAARIERMGGNAGAKYAALTQQSKAGPVWTGIVRLDEGTLDRPLRWHRPRKIFVNSISDLFHESLPDAAIDRVFAVMALAPQHTFQILTKRAERMRVYLSDEGLRFRLCGLLHSEMLEKSDLGNFARTTGWAVLGEAGKWPLPNCWLGVSVEDQTRADRRIPHLLATPAAVRFLSCEPLVGPVDLTSIDPTGWQRKIGAGGWSAIWKNNHIGRAWLDWVIVGSESGSGARPCDLGWVRGLRDQCNDAGVSFFWKQHAERGHKIPTPELDGRQWLEFPR